MKTPIRDALRHAICCAPLLLSILAAGDAAAITVTSSGKTVELPTREPLKAPALPPRNELLTIDWVDASAGRIAIGGITYVVKGTSPRIVLANGDAVSSIGYLKAGMRARVETAVDSAGVERLVAIRIAA